MPGVDRRVLMVTNMKKNAPHQPTMLMLGTKNYKEQVVLYDAATGRKLAESDFFEPLTINSLVAPGFGGRVYFPTGRGILPRSTNTGPNAREPNAIMKSVIGSPPNPVSTFADIFAPQPEQP